MESLFELWKLMDTSEEERRQFERLARIIESPEHEITQVGLLSCETIEKVWSFIQSKVPFYPKKLVLAFYACALFFQQTEAEVGRLTQLKASRMKQLVLQRRLELEEECRKAHIEPDASTETEKTSALIDSGIVLSLCE